MSGRWGSPLGRAASTVPVVHDLAEVTVGLVEWLRRLERETRPVDPESALALDRRWAELPDVVMICPVFFGPLDFG